MRFLCDEMLKGVARWLRAAGYDAALVEDASSDRDILSRATAEDRLLLTRDRKFVERRAADTVFQCHACGRLYWAGSHVHRMRRTLSRRQALCR